MDSHPKWRLRARAALETYFNNRSFPRFTLGLLVTLAGVAGFLISHILLRLGFQEMWLRYPIAVIGGYFTFLIQLRLWVEIERSRFNSSELTISTHPPDEKVAVSLFDRLDGSDSLSWLEWLDFSGALDLGEGCLVGCLFALVIGMIGTVTTAVFTFVMAGPEFLAEVFLDAVVVTMLYRHLKTAAKEHWLGTAVKRTWSSVLLTAAALALLGGGLAVIAPNSHSIVQAWKEIFPKPGPK
ncbi:MAG: hypothetical protein ABI162_20170 [Luteolibacter sp.]